MGIKGLNQFLRGKCPHVFRQVPLSDLRFRKGAVDFSLYVFKYKTIFGDKWLNAIVSLISCMRKNDIHVCFVYDTGAPLEKQAEREQRQAQRDKLSDKALRGGPGLIRVQRRQAPYRRGHWGPAGARPWPSARTGP